MPTKERRLKEAAKKSAVGNGDQKPKVEEKRVPRGGIELINERQETMFDTELTSTVDDYLKSCVEFEAWKKRRSALDRAVIEKMIEHKVGTLRVGQEKILKYKHVEAKDVLTLKDYKAPAPRRRRRM